jgi:AcrR family transcriptional regulator
MSGEPAPKRAYRMGARAEAKEATRERILKSADLWLSTDADREQSLEDIATDAGTTVQTVLRHFGSRDGLIDAVIRRASEIVRRERARVPAGDVPAAIRNLVRHYERWGDLVLRLLAEENRSSLLRKATDRGRAVHLEWVERTFAPQLAPLDEELRKRRVAQLVAVCDVYVWKLLRRDSGLSVAETESAIVELLDGL